ncbi:AAA family ATPase [Coprococcus comes]|uniref:AAA family ATPase n=1 Tax=Coprococcus comes TaxID=410072 RepID=UPI00189B1607|nr:ATP-binding protein [Coprococcus comes]
MLKRVIAKNFKCFKNETIFDYTKTNYKLLEQNTEGKNLKGVLFVGDNASGKTTALQPIKLMLDLLFKDRDISLVMYNCLFSTEKITSLQFEFDVDNHEIKYEFSFDRNVFIEERLTVDDQIVIERVKKNVRLQLEEEKSFHEVDDTLLFLKRVYFSTKFAGNKILIQWFDELKKSVYINAYSRRIVSYNGKSLSVNKYLEENGTNHINKFFEDNNFQFAIQYEKVVEKEGLRFELDENEGKMVFFERQGIETPLPIFMESTGNQTLINILPAILSVVENGGMLLIDEFSSGLHNKLEELLIRYIMRNGKGMQLFFVSHSTNLLSNSILRPDQIYTVEMEGKEGSKIKRFSDEQPRAAQNLEKMYLSGVFGGVPEYGIDRK